MIINSPEHKVTTQPPKIYEETSYQIKCSIDIYQILYNYHTIYST